jgi:hypothetical protein
MKYYLFIVLLMSVAITVGCVNEDREAIVTATPQIVTTSIPTPTAIAAVTSATIEPKPTVTEKWGHGFASTGYDVCDQIHRKYNLYVTWSQDYDGQEYCRVTNYCTTDGCWYWKVHIDNNTDEVVARLINK